VRKNGEPVGYGRSCVRAVTYLPSSQIWIAVPWAVLGLTGRWWHDSAADTKVVPSTSTAGQVADAPGE